MSRRQSYFAYVAFFLGVIGLASFFARPTNGQQSAVAPPLVTRYQMAAAGGNSPYVFVTDTVTGHTWSHTYNRGTGWEDLGTPSNGK